MKLNTLKTIRVNGGSKKRVGRGYGSGRGGHTVGKGMKGQKSRSGHKSMLLFEGGNVPFYRKMPKYRGFKPHEKVRDAVLNISDLNFHFSEGDVVNIEALRKKGLIKKRDKSAKILGYGDLDKVVKVEGLKLSSVAKEKILKLKGEIK